MDAYGQNRGSMVRFMKVIVYGLLVINRKRKQKET
jgi:hypothetical protein